MLRYLWGPRCAPLLLQLPVAPPHCWLAFSTRSRRSLRRSSAEILAQQNRRSATYQKGALNRVARRGLVGIPSLKVIGVPSGLEYLLSATTLTLKTGTEASRRLRTTKIFTGRTCVITLCISTRPGLHVMPTISVKKREFLDSFGCLNRLMRVSS
ncbi:hypothetical protein M514_20424, partial [Trichuris suis]